ncbi:hypothetical protein K3495_g10326 [Podosphaera aphanis]|nr:hypothetical protein K3495_g10326 [Podosphaera aphanis]
MKFTPKPVATPDIFILAADCPPELLDILQDSPSLASSQDVHGYSLLHAAASYNHLELLRRLVTEFNVNVDLKDEDGETPLFVAETVECARILLEELHADITIKNFEGKTVVERLSEDGEFPEVVMYLRTKEPEVVTHKTSITLSSHHSHVCPPLPDGVSMNLNVMDPNDVGAVTDPEFRRKIEDLASREDFSSESGQGALREIVTEALRSDRT